MFSTASKFISKALAILLLVAGFESCLAEAETEEENLIAALSLNVLRFTTWPEPQTSNFNFCIYGDNVTKEAFNSLENKAIGSKSLRVVSLAHLIDLDRCQAVYISEVKQSILLQVFNDLRKKPVLVIGYGETFAETGGMIGLRKLDGKLTIDINLRASNEAGIVISSRLLSLAHIVEQ